jgi:hypothetical protein
MAGGVLHLAVRVVPDAHTTAVRVEGLLVSGL